jgi:predicted ATP-dependent protease
MPRKIKTREELIESGLKMYRVMPQYRDKLASGLMGEDELWEMAARYADKQIEKRTEMLVGEKKTRESMLQSDLAFKEEREQAYREQFEWNDSNDEASLDGLISLEMQMRVVTRELEDPHTQADFLPGLRASLANLTKEHRTLQKDLGIDRTARERAKMSKNTVDDWDRIKTEAKEKLEQLSKDFAEWAVKVETEAELRDRMKYHFAIPFDNVDVILVNHRRVLGLDTTVQKA